jgi:hypothetical protein
MLSPPKPLYRLLLSLFRTVDDLYEFLSTYNYSRAEDLVNSLPGTDVPKTTYFLKAVKQVQAHGLDDQRLFETLAERFPNRRDWIEAARRDYLGVADPDDEPASDELAITSLSPEPVAALAEQQEKVTGERPTFLDVAYLATGYERSKSVAKLRMRFAGRWYAGTAFLVKPDVLLTAHHNLWMDGKRAEEVEVIFDYERASQQPQVEAAVHRPDLDSFLGEEKLDWAAMKLVEPQQKRPLAPLSGKPVGKKDRVAIIQHPNGLPKQVALHHNLVTYVDDRVIQYLTDTEPGSSGSPVFDTDWNVVAVHHLGGDLVVPGTGQTMFCNQGVPIQQVRTALSTKGISF